MKKIIFGLILSLSVTAQAADFTIDLQPAAGSVGDAQVSSISKSKVTGLVSDLSAINASISALSSATPTIADGSVTTAKIADGAVTHAKTVATTIYSGAETAEYNSTGVPAATWVTASTLSVNVVSTGRPMVLMLTSGRADSYFGFGGTSYPSVATRIIESDTGAVVYSGQLTGFTSTASFTSMALPGLSTIRVPPSAGSRSYSFQIFISSGTTFYARYMKLIAYEL